MTDPSPLRELGQMPWGGAGKKEKNVDLEGGWMIMGKRDDR